MGNEPTYGQRLKAHLAGYKETELQIPEAGIYRHKGRLLQYPHILPEHHGRRNLLPAYQDACWAYTENGSNHVKRHLYFHHLNSSQAMCLNLFFPFVTNDHSLLPILQKTLGLPDGAATPEFEKVLVAGENTNFDFFLQYQNGSKVFFELKLSESEFGKADPKKHPGKYEEKFEKYYRDRLSRLLDPKWVEFKTLVKHYQIFRNISYLSPDTDDRLVFVYRRGANHDCFA